MAAIEIIHYMKSKSRGKEGEAASKSWDMNRIRGLFDGNTVTCIEQTPLFDSVRDDTLVWKLDHDGNYSVRSAYNLCVNIAGTHDRFRIAESNVWCTVQSVTTQQKTACMHYFYVHAACKLGNEQDSGS
ncbi:hypothetical protein A2U01_0046210, partial [Trifolium medium]|nr:hypothetical protein [Trifolium medium]